MDPVTAATFICAVLRFPVDWNAVVDRAAGCRVIGNGDVDSICPALERPMTAGELLLVPDDTGIAFLQPTSRKQAFHVKVPGFPFFHGIFASPDGKLVAALVLPSSKTEEKSPVVYLIDVANRSISKTLSPKKCNYQRGGAFTSVYPMSLAFDRDGKTLFTAIGQSISCWEVGSGERLFESVVRERDVHQLLFAPSGAYLISSSDNNAIPDTRAHRFATSVRFWDPRDGRELHKFNVPEGPVHCMALSEDSRVVACSTRWGLSLWEVYTGTQIALLERRSNGVTKLMFAQSDSRLMSVTERGVLEWNLKPKSLSGDPQELQKDDLDKLSDALTEEDAVQGYRAVWTLAIAKDKGAEYLKSSIKSVPREDAEVIGKWIVKLDAEKLAVREEASRHLVFLGPQALPHLRAALKETTSPEVTERLERAIGVLESWAVKDPETLRLLRAIWAFERIGTDVAKKALTTLSEGDSEARPTREAKAALERLSKRKSE
jgi:hypothetical protein